MNVPDDPQLPPVRTPALTPAHRLSQFLSPSRIVLALMLVGFLLFDLLVLVVELQGELLVGPILGMLSTQVTLTAVWTALGSASLMVRVPSGLILAAGVVLLLVVHGAIWQVDEEMLAVSAGLALQWLAIQVPLWGIRIPFGWKLAWPWEVDRAPAWSGETQFGLRQLMGWMVLVCVVMGIAKIAIPSDVFSASGVTRQYEFGMVLALLGSFNALLSWPIIWAVLSRSWTVIWLLLAVACAVGLTLAEYFAFRTALGAVDLDIFILINSVQFVTCAAALLVVRTAGFRLIRQRAFVSAAADV